MRNRKIRILHDGREYYLVDRGRTGASRVITFLKPLADGEEPDAGTVRVKTDIGVCAAIAQWTRDGIRVDGPHEALKPVFEEVVNRYLEEFRVGRKRADARAYWFLSADRRPLFALDRTQPSGLSVLVFTSRERAEAAADARQSLDGRPIEAEAAGDLVDYLSARATEGFAGALLDEREPIYFCLDESGAARFLKLSLDTTRGKLEHTLLQPDGTWSRYDGEEDITPELDQDIVDRHMADRLGDVPFFGFHEGLRLTRLARKGEPDVPATVTLDEDEAGEGQPFCPVFQDAALANDFMAEHRLRDLEPVAVDDLAALAAWCLHEGRPLLLHPEGHRARSGTLWMHDDRLVLDSFSGLWASDDGGTTFTKQ